MRKFIGNLLCALSRKIAPKAGHALTQNDGAVTRTSTNASSMAVPIAGALSMHTILVNKAEILRLDVTGVRRILDSFLPTLVDQDRNSFTVLVNGYEDDPRELIIIPEVRAWFRRLFEVVPEIFFWMDLRQPYLTFYAIMASTPVRRAEGTTLSAADLKQFMVWGYTQLNRFCHAHGFDVSPSNAHIRRCILDEH